MELLWILESGRKNVSLYELTEEIAIPYTQLEKKSKIVFELVGAARSAGHETLSGGYRKTCRTPGFPSTTNAQMPNGIPKKQQGPSNGIIATMAAARAVPYFLSAYI